MMLPPETVEIRSTLGSHPNSAIRRKTPRWNIEALNPPPERARAMRGLIGGSFDRPGEFWEVKTVCVPGSDTFKQPLLSVSCMIVVIMVVFFVIRQGGQA